MVPNGVNTLIAAIPNQFGTAIRVFSNGTIERPFNSPIVPPTLDDPKTGVSSKDVVISPDPLVSLRLYLPKLKDQEKVPILIYFHGGAFYFESAFSKVYHNHCNTFTSEAKVLIVSVEYRLAPEHSLPACFHDCWDALKWVASQNSTHIEPWLIEHGDFNKVFVGGNSAGANIAHNMIVRAGDESLPNGVKIYGAIIIHPFFHSSSPVGAETLKGEENISYVIWNFVYPCAPHGVDNPLFNPVGVGAPSLHRLGCSKIIVCAAGKDRLRERAIWSHEAVKNSGWQGKLELFEESDEGHDYQLLKPQTENAHKLIKRLVSFIQEQE